MPRGVHVQPRRSFLSRHARSGWLPISPQVFRNQGGWPGQEPYSAVAEKIVVTTLMSIPENAPVILKKRMLEAGVPEQNSGSGNGHAGD